MFRSDGTCRSSLAWTFNPKVAGSIPARPMTEDQ
jgi:hypothetical protein